jgi:hypothetical protein
MKLRIRYKLTKKLQRKAQKFMPQKETSMSTKFKIQFIETLLKQTLKLAIIKHFLRPRGFIKCLACSQALISFLKTSRSRIETKIHFQATDESAIY